jgi:hypothetical protein
LEELQLLVRSTKIKNFIRGKQSIKKYKQEIMDKTLERKQNSTHWWDEEEETQLCLSKTVHGKTERNLKKERCLTNKHSGDSDRRKIKAWAILANRLKNKSLSSPALGKIKRRRNLLLESDSLDVIISDITKIIAKKNQKLTCFIKKLHSML